MCFWICSFTRSGLPISVQLIARRFDEAIKFYQQAEDILAKDLPVLPLRFGQNNYGFSTNVKNVKFDQFSRLDLIRIEKA